MADHTPTAAGTATPVESADVPSRTGAEALTGWARFVFHLRLVYVTIAIRRRLPVPMIIGPFRRIGTLLDDATLVPAMTALEPGGVSRTLDVRYGEEKQQLLDVFRPVAASDPLPVVVWVHGGSWVGGTKDALRPYLATLAARGFVTVGVDYTWAPEMRYPGQIEQIAAALVHLRESGGRHGLDTGRIVLAGDSAGAHIAGQLARALSDEGYARRAGIRLPHDVPRDVRGVVLTSGPFRITSAGEGGPHGKLGDFLLRAYTGRRDYATDPTLRCASLVDDVDRSFPPAFVSAGTVDPMLEDSRALAEALTDAGADVETAFYADDHEPPLPHEFAVDLRRPEARAVLDRITAFVHRCVAAPGVSIER